MTDNTNARKTVLKNVRIRYPQLAEARENRLSNNGKKYFSAQIIINENDDANLKLIKEKIAVAFTEKFGAERGPKMMRAASENKNTRGLQHDVDNGWWYINSKRIESRGAPKVFNRALQEVSEPSELPQGGDFIDCVVQPWCYDNNGSRGVSFELVSVRVRERGEPFPGQGLKASADDFEALAPKTDSANDDVYATEQYF